MGGNLLQRKHLELPELKMTNLASSIRQHGKIKL